MSSKGPVCDRTGELFELADGPKRFELLSCGHGAPPSGTFAKTARCLVCGGARAWKLLALGWLVDAAAAVAEGRRLLAVAELTELGIPIPAALAVERHPFALHRVLDVGVRRPSGRATVVAPGADE